MNKKTKPIYVDCDYTSYADKFAHKRRKKRLLKFIAWLCVLAVLIFSISESIRNKDSPTIADYSRAQLKAITTTVINNAVLECVTSSLSYSELITIHKDNQGRISLIESNWSFLNLIARQTAVTITNQLNEVAKHGIRIPLGNLTGWPLLTGIGPEIEITISPQESVECTFDSEFVSAGINQTLHKIYLDIVTYVDLVMPTYETTIVNTSQILLTEGVIVGQVPQIYLDKST